MANKTCANLIATIRARAGRSNDTVLITTSFVLDALNEGQLGIVKRIPRQIDLDKSDSETYQISTDDTSINITTLDPAHIGGIWILNGSSTRRAGLKYLPLDEFRRKYPLVSEESASEPVEYTRQGNTIYFNCPVSSDYNELYLRIDYTKKPDEFDSVDSDETSELSDSNEGLILYTLAKVYNELALAQPKFETKAIKTLALFEKWLAEYMEYNDMLLEELTDE